MRAGKAILMLLALVAVPMLTPAQTPGYPPAQGQAPPPPSYPPARLDQLVQRIALYPDPLLVQVLAAATYPDQIPDRRILSTVGLGLWTVRLGRARCFRQQ